jgi:hypothetical protein
MGTWRNRFVRLEHEAGGIMHDEMGTSSWRPRQADGTVFERWTGTAFIHVEPVTRTLVDAGPAPAATAA